jgi:hypothetical protein
MSLGDYVCVPMNRSEIAFALILTAAVAQMGCSTAFQHPRVSEANSVSRRNWPPITEFHEKIHFDTTMSRKFKGTIFSSSGIPLYILDARIPSDSDPDEGYDYSGGFDCRLYSVRRNDDGYPTLLQNVRNATADWETDGRFLSTELVGLVGANTSRVILQRSKMRGMAVEIEVGSVILDAKTGYVRSFDVSFSFRNDPAALSDIAANQSR